MGKEDEPSGSPSTDDVFVRVEEAAQDKTDIEDRESR